MVTRRASAGQRSWQRFTVTVTQSAKAAQSAASGPERRERIMRGTLAREHRQISCPDEGSNRALHEWLLDQPTSTSLLLPLVLIWFRTMHRRNKKYFNNSTQKLIRKRCNCRFHGEVPPCLSQHKPLQHLHTSAHTVLVTI